MIGKLILLPVWVLRKSIGACFGIIRLVLGSAFGLTKFVFGRRVGTIAILAIGFFLGKKFLENSKKQSKEE